MMGLYVLAVFLYVTLLILRVQAFALSTEKYYQLQLQDMEERYARRLAKHDESVRRRQDLETEAEEIFALYEITKDITKTFNEGDALKIFKEKLRQHVRFDDCEFLDPESEKVKDLRKDLAQYIFTLKWKNSKLGYLNICGMSSKDHEKAGILGHQFALALRRVRLYQEIERVAITDGLTGVYTRRYALERFDEDLKRSRAREMKASLLMIDVDHFKDFNDHYGHLVGDGILKGIADIVRHNIREIDIAGRYGGEEFCVILPDTGREGAEFVAQRIRTETEKAQIRAYDTKVNVTVSIGSSTFPDDGKLMATLIDKADWALYRAKRLGRNRVCLFGLEKYEEES